MLNKHIEPERVEMVMKMVNGEDVGSVPVGKELGLDFYILVRFADESWNSLAQQCVLTEAYNTKLYTTAS